MNCFPREPLSHHYKSKFAVFSPSLSLSLHPLLTLRPSLCYHLRYPVFPWVVRDYESTELALNDPKSFRDLRLPMGAQDEGECAAFVA